MIKLKIEAYKTETFSDSEKVGTFTVRFNPEELNQSYKIEYNNTQSPGSSGTVPKFVKIVPNQLDITILFDKTIVKHDETVPEINDQLDAFKALVCSFNSETHRPNFLKLSWGTFIFKGQLKDYSVNFVLYNGDGVPLRAKAVCKFMQIIDDQTRSGIESPASADLTHIYLIREGDTLPMIADKYYGDPSYYIELAKVNELDNFRELRAGDQLVIPPLTK